MRISFFIFFMNFCGTIAYSILDSDTCLVVYHFDQLSTMVVVSVMSPCIGALINVAIVLQLNNEFIKILVTVSTVNIGGIGLESWIFLSFFGGKAVVLNL